jgi:pimeloyl-ACP methyl ester carboxylesterase
MTTANPIARFYAAPALRGLSLLLHGLDGIAPQAGARLALRLFGTPRGARKPLPPADWRLESMPFEGQSLTVWRRDDAVPGAEPVLLVHGWAGDAAQMLPLAEAVRAVGLNPLVIELPAHGRSRIPRSNAVQWSRALFVVTSRYGPWAAAIGHSIGALALAQALSRGLPARRAALVAISPPPRLFINWFAGVLGLPHSLAERMTLLLERQEGADMRAFEASWLGPRLAQPTLLVHDRDDRVAPMASSEQLAAELSAGELVRTEGLGHRRVLADAAVVQRVSEFVSGRAV